MSINPYKDRAAGAAKETSLAPSFISRLNTMYQYIVRGRIPDWFGPGDPLDPIAPDQTKGRQFDYPVGINTAAIQPKANEGISFYKLRMLADTLDIMRLILEDFKDQICKMEWRITKRVDEGATSKADKKSDELEALFMAPDGEHDWDDWLRMLLEDVLVVDALAIYPTLMGGQTRFEIIDGTTFKRIIGDDGRTPRGEKVAAYQQILKGVPANSYTNTELVYKVRNPRSWKIYGFSPIEQTIITITMALWRQASQMSYYTDGSTPDLIMSLPKEWTTDQIAKFKIWWDSILMGNVQEKRGTMFVPDGSKPYETKEKVLTDKMEDWIARVLCYSLRISPHPFVSSFNRAEAESAKEQSKENGIGSMMIWVKRLMDRLMWQYMGAKEYEFRWKEEDETDPETKAKINDLKIRNGSKLINECRAEDGEDPIEGGNVALIITPSGAIRLEDAVKGQVVGTAAPTAQPAEAPAKPAQTAAAPAKPTPKNTGAKLAKVVPSGVPMVRLTATVAATLLKLRTSVFDQLKEKLELTKAVSATPSDILNQLDLSGFDDLSDDMIDAITQAVHDGWQQGMISLHAGDGAPMLAPDAGDYAESEVGDLLSTRLPDSTRMFIRETVIEAIDESWTADQLAEALQGSYAFSDIRARTIADTELAKSTMRGVYGSWQQMGVLGKSWAVSPDDNNCPICLANEAQGVIPLGEPFQSGHQYPTAHPNCHCDLIPHTSLEDAE